MADGVVATSYGSGQKFFIDPMKLLPLERFLPKPKGAPAPGGRGEWFLLLTEANAPITGR
jgi:H/ACA ribonucleoprotein complex subunit 1